MIIQCVTECPPKGLLAQECYGLDWPLRIFLETSPGLASIARGEPELLPTLRTLAFQSLTFPSFPGLDSSSYHSSSVFGSGTSCPLGVTQSNPQSQAAQTAWDNPFSKSTYWGKGQPSGGFIPPPKGLSNSTSPNCQEHPQRS